MYCILVYDVEQKRVGKVLKLMRKYLHWVQNSVFEGEIRKSDFYKMKLELEKKINKKKDSVIIFTFNTPKWINRGVLGKEKGKVSNVL